MAGRRMKLYFDDITSTASCSAAWARPTRGWPTSGNAWPSPGRSRRATGTAGTGPGLISRPGWSARPTTRPRPGTRSAPGAPTCARPSTSGRPSSSTATTWTGPSCAAPIRQRRRVRSALDHLAPRPRPVRAGLGLLFPRPQRVGRADRGRHPARRRLRRHRRRAVRLGRARARSRYVFAALDGPGQGSCCTTGASRCGRTGRRRAGHVRRHRGAARGRSGAHRPGRAVVRRADRAPRRGRGTPAGRVDRRPRPVGHGRGRLSTGWVPLAKLVDDSLADPQFEALLGDPAMKALLTPRMVTNGATTVRAYCADMRRYNNIGTAPRSLARPMSRTTSKDEASPARARSCSTTSPARRSSACSPRPKEPRAIARAWPDRVLGRRVQLAGLVAVQLNGLRIAGGRGEGCVGEAEVRPPATWCRRCRATGHGPGPGW